MRVYTKTSAMDFTELSTILGTQLGKTRGKSPTSTARDTCNKETRMRRNAALFRLERNTDPTAPELEGTSNLQLWLSTCTSDAYHRERCIGVTDREPFVRCSDVKTPTFKSTTSEIVCGSAAKHLSRLLSRCVFARCFTRAQLANVGHDLYSHDNNFLATSSSQVDVSFAVIIQGYLVGRFSWNHSARNPHASIDVCDLLSSGRAMDPSTLYHFQGDSSSSSVFAMCLSM